MKDNLFDNQTKKRIRFTKHLRHLQNDLKKKDNNSFKIFFDDMRIVLVTFYRLRSSITKDSQDPGIVLIFDTYQILTMI